MSQALSCTISVLQFVPWLAALDALGIDSDRILARAGIARDRLTDPTGRLPAELDRVFWDAAIAESGDPALSLRIAPCLPTGAFGSFEYVLRSSVSLEQTVSLANEFMRLIDDLAQIELVREGELGALRLSRLGAFPMAGEGVETTFALMIAIAREIGAPPGTDLREVRFTHVTTAPLTPYRAYFGCPVRFAAAHNELVFDARLISAALPGDANLNSVLSEHARHQLARVPQVDPLLHTVRGRLLEQMRAGPPNLAAVARSIHVSERTLRRHLQSAGSSYQTLLDELRAQLAIDYLQNSDTAIANVAAQLGFADPSTFYRAFKRWTGMTPLQYQKRARSK
jgi:AraC-like DNA-binding protein